MLFPITISHLITYCYFNILWFYRHWEDLMLYFTEKCFQYDIQYRFRKVDLCVCTWYPELWPGCSAGSEYWSLFLSAQPQEVSHLTSAGGEELPHAPSSCTSQASTSPKHRNSSLLRSFLILEACSKYFSEY